MILRRAMIDDIETLITLRIDYLIMDKGGLSADDEIALRAQLRGYFEKHLPLGDFIAVLAEKDGYAASAAFLVISERPANPGFITGKTGMILNVITYPEYRRQGLATRVLNELLVLAKSSGVFSVDLYATADGKPVYEKLGFKEPPYTAMRLKL